MKKSAEQSIITYTGDKQYASFLQLIETLSAYHHFDLSEIDRVHINKHLFAFSTNPSLGFPASEINRIEIVLAADEIKQYQLQTSFLGLNGSTSPLPGFYMDTIASDYAIGEKTKAQYFDFFNHRLMGLFIKAWRKYRYYIHHKEDNSDVFSKRLFAFVGIDNFSNTPPVAIAKQTQKNTQPIQVKTGVEASEKQAQTERQQDADSLENMNWDKLLYFMGILTSRVRSPAMITSIIKHYLNLTNVTIKEWQKQKVNILPEQTNRLGQQNMVLSDSFMLGGGVISYAKKYVVVIDDLDMKKFYGFLPGGRQNTILRNLITFLMKDLLPYDIHLGVGSGGVGDSPEFVLGNEQHSLLGWTTFMKSNEDADVMSIAGASLAASYANLAKSQGGHANSTMLGNTASVTTDRSRIIIVGQP